jgi:phospholipid-hydroperoxide glutathione peroxidase
MFLRVLTIISLLLIVISILTNYLLIKYSIIETMATNGTTEEPKTIYEFVAKDIDGNDVKLDKYKGFPLIVVNVASNCGFTKTNYKELNEIYDKYEEKGLKILAFPCNQFLGQEPACDVDIKEFAKKNNARYDFFAKIEVNGDNAHPLWKWLKQKQSGFMGSFIKWNFTKFLINREGVPVKRFGPSTSPSKMETDIIAIL